MPFQNRHVSFVSYSLEVGATGMSDVMILETDLHLNSRHPGYNPDAVNALVQEARAYLAANAGHVCQIRLTTTRGGEI
jgi:hypothetical protein